jgi:hypothetical protein
MAGLKTACQNPELLMKELDIAGRRIEALDRSMTSIRQLYFVVLGILAAGISPIFRTAQLPDLLQFSVALTFVVLMAGFILWQLDSHYHQYLREAIFTSETIEKKLGFSRKNRLGLTVNLEAWRDDNQSGKIIPAEIYMGPTILMMVGIFSMTVAYGVIYGNDEIYYWSAMGELMLLTLLAAWSLRVRDFLRMD